METAPVAEATGRRLPHLPAAVIGNGSLLATLSARGELERMFWPRVDWGQHLGELRIGIFTNGGTLWLDEEPFVHRQRYFDDASVLETVAVDDGLEVEIVDYVDPEAPILVRRIRATRAGLRLVVYCRPELDESARYGGGLADRDRGRIVFYRRNVALALGLAGPAAAGCGRIADGAASELFAQASFGQVGANTAAHGAVDGALAGELDGEAVLLCAFGESVDLALGELERHRARPHDRLLRDRLAHDSARLARSQPLDGAVAGVEALYRRSLLVFDLVADRDTGGVIAAPELDPDFVHSGGYGFVWPRDLAFGILSFLAAGRTELVERAVRWSLRTQSDQGVWLQRHCTDGFLAPSWTELQLDETATLLFAYEAVYRELGDAELDRELWPAVHRAADFLYEFRDRETGLPSACFDLWEERKGQHAYTAATVVAGLRAAAAIAGRHEPALVPSYAEAAEDVRRAIEASLWNEELGHYVRALRDERLDASLLGLAWPFGVVAPGSPRMRSTVAAIERALATPTGGLRRYVDDTYAGGHAWVLASLWLGLSYRQVGDEAGYRRCLRFACDAQTELGLLPEQVTEDGRPAWVLPLTWSHAMFVLAARPELVLVRVAAAAQLS